MASSKGPLIIIEIISIISGGATSPADLTLCAMSANSDFPPSTAEGVNFDYFQRLISGICNILVILLSPNKMQLLQQLLRLWRDKE